MINKQIIKAYTLITILLSVCTSPLYAQPDQNIIDAITKEAWQNSQLEMLGQELLDDIGPRLVGTPQSDRGYQWLVKRYQEWGIQSYLEPYGTWRSWERGTTVVQMISPRMLDIVAWQLAWSPSTGKKPIIADVVALPIHLDSLAFQRWLPSVKGKLVMISDYIESGRPEQSWKEHARESDYKDYLSRADSNNKIWQSFLKRIGYTGKTLPLAVEKFGAAGLLSSYWSGGWGANRIMLAYSKKIPTIEIGMPDYARMYRLLKRGITPRLSVTAHSKELGQVQVHNGIAKIQGTQHPDEIILLSAHFDSWDGGDGATDNGTGTIVMMEAMRILKKVYPNPKRTIMVGHWNSEEQGLNGSKAFFEDHPDIRKNISLVLNQDNGTGRIKTLQGQGFLHAYQYFNKWFSYIPRDARSDIETYYPGAPDRGSSDHATFVQNGIPGFFPLSGNWDYGQYTWHTNHDTYDKINFNDVRRNVVLYATLVYLACEEDDLMKREKAILPWNKEKSAPTQWPEYKNANRAGGY